MTKQTRKQTKSWQIHDTPPSGELATKEKLGKAKKKTMNKQTKQRGRQDKGLGRAENQDQFLNGSMKEAVLSREA